MDYHDQRRDGPRRVNNINLRRKSSSEDEDKAASRDELRQKSKEMHQFLNKHHHNGKRNGDINEVIPFTSGTSNNNNSPRSDTVFHSPSQPYSQNSHRRRSCVEDSIASDSDITVTQSDSGHSKEVVLTTDLSGLSGNESDGIDLCQKLFGIVIFQYSNGKSGWNSFPLQRRLVVQGLVEGSPAQTSGRIQRGDLLVKINNKEVTWLNFFKVLSSIRKREKVKLIFQSPRTAGPKSSYQVLQVPDGDLCQALVGKRLDQILVELSRYPCLLLYLTFVSSSSSETEVDLKEDIIYAFPGEEETLTPLRGLFITLTATVADVIGQATSTTLLTLPDSRVSVAYLPCGRDVLILALPQASVSMFRLTHMLDALHSLLVLLYGDAKSAFLNANRLWLDKLVVIMMHNTLGLDSHPPSSAHISSSSLLSSHSHSSSSSSRPSTHDPSAMFCHKLPLTSVGRRWSVRDLPLSYENKLICDEILTEFESMEFDSLLDKEELFNRRKYVILGCSLYYKEFLVRSHLSSSCQKDLNLFMNCHGLLSIASKHRADQIFIWQELNTCSDGTGQTQPGYTPTGSKRFIMVVGMHHYLLGVWIEARGNPSLPQGQLHPLPLLIEQAKATLAQLEIPEVHMARCCQEKLNGQGDTIQLASADQLCCQPTSLTPRRPRLYSNEMMARRPPGVSHKPVLTPTKGQDGSWKSRSKSLERLDNDDDGGSSNHAMKRQGSKISFESNDSAGSGSSAGHTKGKGSSVSSVGDLSNISRSVSILHILDPFRGHKSMRICRGRESALLYHMTFDLQDGVLICPTNGELNAVLSPLQQDVLYNFHISCQRMAQNFVFTGEQTSEEDSGRGTQSLSTFSRDREPLVEQGVLFSCCLSSPSQDRKHGNINLDYWVIGRKQTVPSVREMYICFHESTHQEMVETAFSLGFGS